VCSVCLSSELFLSSVSARMALPARARVDPPVGAREIPVEKAIGKSAYPRLGRGDTVLLIRLGG
jgi:hypothetical protein